MGDRLLRAGVTATALMLGVAVAARQPAASRTDALRATLAVQAEKTVLSERCAECHRSEAGVWAKTAHKTGFDTLHTKDSAKKIYAAMGLSVIKRGTEETTPACLQCHYTPVLRGGQLRAGEGVTCESCHGPGRDWISVHNDYGVQGVAFQEAARRETPEHRTARIERSRAAGMRRPSDLYGVAANCFACHTVPNEDLVNRGGHTTGTIGFDFLAASQGHLRHNFLDSFKTGDGNTNAERSPAHKRLLFVVARMVDLEYSLRAAAEATSDGRYFGAVAERVNHAADNVVDMLRLAPAPELTAALDAQKAADVRVNNRVALTGAADRIRDLTQQWLLRADGVALAAIDPLWNADVPAAAPPVPVRAAPAVVAPPTPAVATPPPPVSTPAVSPPSSPTPTPPASRPGPTSTGTPPSPVAATSVAPRYPVNTQPVWRSATTRAYLPDVPCGNCHQHNGQDTWWRKDRHSQSLKPLRSLDPKYVAIATKYGIAPADMTSRGQICVWCHGTATSPRASRVPFAVGCQQCHGPGADYKDPHQKGYSNGVAAGLTDLKNATVRATTCAGCHYITDPGLIAAGHSTGKDFDIAQRMDQIKHWGDKFG
ncbi:MAG TPA: multiheme c-type cytochrome, partial [Planctomycetaceae bacterium]|nr:multiheme c-type cytochrome [Planctomycetaceae bacterium]